MAAEPDDIVMLSRAELDVLRAENRRLRLESEARRPIQDRPSSGGRTFMRNALTEAWSISK